MGNLFNIKQLGLSFFLILFLVTSLRAQEEQLVFKASGHPKIFINDSIKPAKKGSILDHKSTVSLENNDTLRLVDKTGNLRELHKKGRYNLDQINALRPTKLKSDFATKYFKYIWKELTEHRLKPEDKSGVVYRGDDLILMRFPSDSIRIYMTEINFEWEEIPDKEGDYHFFLKDVETNKIKRQNSSDTFMTLSIDDNNLKYGHDYAWAVSENRFPDFQNLRFYQFRVISKIEYDDYRSDLKKLTKQLREIGMTRDEIKKSICEISKFCY